MVLANRLVNLFILVVFFMISSCSSQDSTSDGDSADGDQNIPTDGDAEFSTDGDTELSTDGDTELSTDGDTELSIDGDAEFSTDGDTELSTDGDTESSGEGDTEDQPFMWVRQLITIDDEIVNGTSLMTPIDGVTFGYNQTKNIIVTSFARTHDNPDETYFWQIDLNTNLHTKWFLSGEPFPNGTIFCMDDNWCQLIGFDSENQTWLVTGPLAPSIMSVNANGVASLSSVSGSQPSSSFISYAHYFDWTNRKLFLYGWIAPANFATKVYVLDLDTGVWSSETDSLEATTQNCIAYDPTENQLYSFGGITTDDGGETSDYTSSFKIIDLADKTETFKDLPSAIGKRHQMSCVFDQTRQAFFVFGGAYTVDRFDEDQNTYNNDLWMYKPDTKQWTQILLNSDLGTFEEDNYGDMSFTGNPEFPNFGQNRGLMKFDITGDRLMLIGSVPRFTHEQLYILDISTLPKTESNDQRQLKSRFCDN